MAGKIPSLSEAPSNLKIYNRVIRFYSPTFQRWIIRAMPRGNGGTTPKRAILNANFKMLTQLIKRVAVEQRIAVKVVTDNSPYLDRDILMKAAAGRLIAFTDTNGLEWSSARDAMKDIQTLLDNISSAEGSMLVRSDVGWVAILPGLDGFVMTVDPATGYPQWMEPQGGGGGNGLYANSAAGIMNSYSGYPYASLGTMLLLEKPITVSEIKCPINAVIGEQYQASIWSCVGNLAPFLDVNQVTSSPFTVVTTGAQMIDFSIPSTVLPAGQYVVMGTWLNAGGPNNTFKIGLNTGQGGWDGIPVDVTSTVWGGAGNAALGSVSPVHGDTFACGMSPVPYFQLRVSF